MKKMIHTAVWKTTWAKICTVAMAILTVVPVAAPHELAQWFSEQMPFLPSWASIGAAAAIGTARLGIAVWKVASEQTS